MHIVKGKVRPLRNKILVKKIDPRDERKSQRWNNFIVR